MKNLELTSGIQRLPVIVDGQDTGHIVMFNPADQEFVETLYALVHRIGEIHKEKERHRSAETDVLKKFAFNREEDQQMREAVDDVFGSGFSGDVFQTRLFALSEDGLTVVESFLFSLLDQMDEGITAKMAKRDANIRKYTDKYKKYR